MHPRHRCPPICEPRPPTPERSQAGPARSSGSNARRDVGRVALERGRDDRRRWRRRGSPGTSASSASRSTACASARRRSTFDDHRVARGRTRGSRTTPPAPGVASAATSGHQVGEPRRVADRRPCRARRARTARARRPRPSATNSTPRDVARPGPRRTRRAARARAGRRSAAAIRNAPLTTWRPDRRPRVAVALDRVARLRPAVGAVHHAHEVRRGRGQPELDRAVVERPDADRGRRPRCAAGSSPGRSRARSRSPPTSPGRPGSRTRLMPNSTSCAVSGVAVATTAAPRAGGTRSAARRRRSPTARRARARSCARATASTSRSNSCMHSWMFGHAIADFGSGSFGQEARRHAQRRRRRAGERLAAASRSSNARWYVSFASANRSDMCSASASLNSTSAIACRSPRRSRIGSSSR